MSEHSQRYISKKIRRIYRRRILAPIVYLTLLFIVWISFPLEDILFPQRLDSLSDLERFYHMHSSYICTELKDLYFTGYTNTTMGFTNGYYYYTMQKGQCYIILLSPGSCQEGLSYIPSVRIRGRVLKGGPSYDTLLDQLSQDLSWTKEGISQKADPYYLSEPAFQLILNTVLFGTYFATGVYALARFFLCALYLFVPLFSPPCRRLKRFGKPRTLLAQAEAELACLPHPDAEDIFLSEHFFIVLAKDSVAVVPIQEIIWVYKYSRLHKILWYHFRISYSLRLTAKKRFYLQCPKNAKTDIDHIMDDLAEANHEILLGFCEENRLKARKIQRRALVQKLARLLVKLKK